MTDRTRPEIVIVVAVAENGVIGVDGGLPWHLPEDLKHFKRTTLGHPVIMGRRTLDELGGKPLPGRRNIILSRREHLDIDGAEHARSLDDALRLARTPNASWPEPPARICIAGGAQIYAEGLGVADTIELTRIHASPEGDTSFPPMDQAAWVEVASRHRPADESHAHAMTFLTLRRAEARR